MAKGSNEKHRVDKLRKELEFLKKFPRVNPVREARIAVLERELEK